MGGPRASTVRQIEAGKRCYMCGRQMETQAGHRGERKCEACSPHRRVYMSFFHRDGWSVQFLEPDLRTPICRMRNFASPEKIRDLVARTPTKMILENRQAFEYGISHGRGGIYLDLTAEQYRKLKG